MKIICRKQALIACLLFLLCAEIACHAPIKGGQTIRQAAKPFTVQVQVFYDRVDITVSSAVTPLELNENLRVEQWHDADASWHFAACPLWMCATKETVFRKTVPAGGMLTVVWNRKLHDGCRCATAGRYRTVLQSAEGDTLIEPVEFALTE